MSQVLTRTKTLRCDNCGTVREVKEFKPLYFTNPRWFQCPKCLVVGRVGSLFKLDKEELAARHRAYYQSHKEEVLK